MLDLEGTEGRGPDPKLIAAMERRGFTGLTAVQKAVLAEEAYDRDLRISSQTGSGKTVAIGLVLARAFGQSERVRSSSPRALVITPTRELAAQVQSELQWLLADLDDCSVVVVTGGTDIGRERQALRKRPSIVVATPGRLLDHIRGGAVDCSEVRHVVLDEADQMLDMGFRDELDAIVDVLPAERRSHLVSATFPAAVRRLADKFQTDPLIVQGTQLGVANEDIEHLAHLVRVGDLYPALVNVLLAAQGERCLVFVRRRDEASELAERLAQDGFSAMPLSGDLSQVQRTRALQAFRTGVISTLVATDVAARGIDVADISTVVHVQPPDDVECYVHRSGRTGRAGRKGQSVLLVPMAAERRVRRVLGAARIDAKWGPPPSPKAIEKAVTKANRRRLHATLQRRTAEPLPEAERTYALKLLEEHDPALLVATLLDLCKPPLPRAPMRVQEVSSTPRSEPRDGRDPRDNRHPDDRGGDGRVRRTDARGQGPARRHNAGPGPRRGRPRRRPTLAAE